MGKWQWSENLRSTWEERGEFEKSKSLNLGIHAVAPELKAFRTSRRWWKHGPLVPVFPGRSMAFYLLQSLILTSWFQSLQLIIYVYVHIVWVFVSIYARLCMLELVNKDSTRLVERRVKLDSSQIRCWYVLGFITLGLPQLYLDACADFVSLLV